MENSIEAPPNISSSGEFSPESRVAVQECFMEPQTITAYYSALRLLQLIETLQIHHKNKLLAVDTEQILGFQSSVHSLMELLDTLSSKDVTSDIQALTTQAFIDCAFKWSNIIDRHVVDKKIGIYGNESGRAISAFNEDIVIVIQEIEEIIQQLTNICGECSSLMSAKENVVQNRYKIHPMNPVGIEHPLRKIKEELFSMVKDRQVITIVGMGGSGKTTLAKKVYEDLEIRKKFERCYWVTVSQDHDVRKILQDILDDKNTYEIRDLGTKLHHEIFNRRYFIVLDDLWSMEAWEELVIRFPENTERSRIIVTTRDSTVAESLSPAYSHKMDLLDEETSWDLLSKQVFDGEDCPDELQDIGRDIARNCKGLPISIITICGLLSRSDRTLEYWSYVATSITLLVGIEDNEHSMKILSLSYESIPIHLKLCFLSLASYPEDASISVNDLIKLWIVNAYVKPKAGRGIEEVALDYLKDLVRRNMVFVRKFDGIEEIETLGMHDLLLELCRKKASIENVHVDRVLRITTARCVGCSTTHFIGFDGIVPMKCCGRIFHQLLSIVVSWPPNSACFCLECYKFEIREHFSSRMHHNFSSRTISVCEVNVPHFHGLANNIVCFESLENSNYHFPGNVLWNVQEYGIYTRQSYQMMPQLRFSTFVPTSNDEVIFEQLIGVGEIIGESEHSHMMGYRPASWEESRIYFPHSLKRLSICSVSIYENDMRAIMDLPNLEQLAFKYCDSAVDEWCGSRSLKYLGISYSVLGNLIVSQNGFPQLVTLWLRNADLDFCDFLSGISSFLFMRLDECGPSVIESAKAILEKKRSLGDENFHVMVDGSLLRLDVEDANCSLEELPSFKKSDGKEEEEGDFALFEMMMMSMNSWNERNSSDVIEYQSRLHKAQQQEHLFIFGQVGREMVKLDAATTFKFPNLKVIREMSEWDGFPLPPSLKKLRLNSYSIDDRRTKCIMELHNLEQLRFYRCTFENDEWCSLSEGKFSKLKLLELDSCYRLKYLTLGEDQFPQLLTLGIRYLSETLQISDDICGILSLTSIRLQLCGNSIVRSAKEIMKVRKEEGGDDSFYVEVDHQRNSQSEDIESDDED